jgi:uncharacterized protein (TIGR03437 family)
MRRVCAKFSIAFFLCLAGSAWAQQAFVPEVIATPGTPSPVLYGLYNGTLIKSGDLGSTWLPLYITEPGVRQPPIKAFVLDAADPNTLYVGTTFADGGLWKSTDGGSTWAQAISGIPTTGGAIEFLDEIFDPTAMLYAKSGNQLFKSTDGGARWNPQGILPGNGPIAIAPSRRSWMYYIEPSSLMVSYSTDEGHSWALTGGSIPASLQGASITGMAVPYSNPATLYVSVNGVGLGVGAYGSFDQGASFTDQTDNGLGLFSQMFTGSSGPSFAVAPDLSATYRSTSMMTPYHWQGLGSAGLIQYGVTAVDPLSRTIVYADMTDPSGKSLVRSADDGDHWTKIAATITPTLLQPTAMYSVTLEQGAPYSLVFTVRTEQDPSWQTPVSLTTTGEAWLQLGAPSGSTPLTSSLTIDTTGLAPGTYMSSIRIDAPGTLNKSVTVPVQLTVRPLGSLGPGYLVSTVAGNGNSGETRTSGAATSLALGAVKAMTFDTAGNLFLSASNRIWQFKAGNLTAIAGNGTNGSNGDGTDPLTASISDPDALAFDSQGSLYFSEYSTERVRKLSSGDLSTYLDMTRPPNNQPVGSHTLLLDSVNRLLLTNPKGLLRFDGARLTVATPYTFSDPAAMVADLSGNLYIADRGLNQVLEINTGGVVSVVAGTGLAGFGGDGGPATQAMLSAPQGLAFGGDGTLYISDSGNQRIRAITPDGNIETIAGSGLTGFSGDGTTGDFASFQNPGALAVDSQGHLYIADTGNNRVRLLVLQSPPMPKPAALAGHDRATKLAPGAVFSLYGSELSSVVASVTTAPWPRSLSGVSVTINGIAAPLYSVSPGQINGQIPFETGVGTATAIVANNGSPTAQITFPVVAAEPDIFEQTAVPHQALAVNQDSSINSPSTPAHPGDIEVLYLTGIGIPDQMIPTGAASPSTPPLAMVNYPYMITVNGEQTMVYYLGYAPGYPALVQANFKVPSDLAPGDYQLVVTVNGEASVPVTISVR